MKAQHWTTIGRPIDLHYSTNRAIAGLTAACFVGGTLGTLAVHGPRSGNVVFGLVFAGAVFLGWALAREIDPDHDRAAFVAASLAALSVVLVGRPDFLLLFWVLLWLRVVNRSTGLPAGWADSVAILGLSIYQSLRWGWVLLAFITLVYLLDALLRPRHRIHLVFGGMAAGAAVGVGWTGGWRLPGGTVDLPWVLLMVIAGAGILAWTCLAPVKHALGDQTGLPLHPRRVRSAVFLALLAGTGPVVLHGEAGVRSTLVLWAVFVGVAAYGLVRAAISATRAR